MSDYRSPPIQRPTYIGLAGADEIATGITDTGKMVVEKVAPIGSMIAGAIVAASAFYFMPKVWDWILATRNDGFSGNFHGLSDTDFEPVELDVET